MKPPHRNHPMVMMMMEMITEPDVARAPLLRMDILSAVPQTFDSVLNSSIIKRACDRGLAQIVVHNLHDYGLGRYRQVDDTPYGGGAGMILRVEPVAACIDALQTQRRYDDVVYLTPDGDRLDQKMVNQMSMNRNLILLCGHYKGIDQRIRELYVTREVSIGDYVLSGGELPALVLADALVRILPGAIGDSQSALLDSFQDGLLDAPHYTKPAQFRGLDVPPVLLSGDHARIAEWRQQQALQRTRQRRPDLLPGDQGGPDAPTGPADAGKKE